MSQQQAAVAADEFVLRRIHRNQVDAGPPPAVGLMGFRPTPEDTAGLSVYREKFVRAAEVAASGRKPGEYYVTRLSVAALKSLGLTVVADEQADGPDGHALIPELSLAACQRDKPRWRAIQVRLAEMANNNIICTPIVEEST